MPPTLTIKILTAKWQVKFLPDKTFPKHTVALTHPDDREIHLRRSKTTLQDVVHELTHAYLDECGFGDSIELTSDQKEEVFCEVNAKHGFVLLCQASDIYRSYLQLKQRS